jgi:hypothetical protein
VNCALSQAEGVATSYGIIWGMHRLIATLVLLLALPTASAVEIDFSSKKSGMIAWPQAEVHDLWAEDCAPRVERVDVEQSDIVLTALLPDAACAKRLPDAKDAASRLTFVLPALWAGIYRVRYEVRPAPGEPAQLHGFRLVDFTPPGSDTLRPETGLWWPEQGGEFNRAGPGLGLLMETQADTLSLTVLGYGADGQAHWSYGASRIEGRFLDIELAELSDGAGPFTPYRAPKGLSPSGSVKIELLSAARANLWFQRPTGDGREISLEPLSMVRFSFAQPTPEAWLGRWVIAAESGDTPASRHIDFTALERTPDGFELIEASGEYRLACRLPPERPNSPPSQCNLIGADLQLEMRFDRTALSELRGHLLTGEPVVALRLKR